VHLKKKSVIVPQQRCSFQQGMSREERVLDVMNMNEGKRDAVKEMMVPTKSCNVSQDIAGFQQVSSVLSIQGKIINLPVTLIFLKHVIFALNVMVGVDWARFHCLSKTRAIVDIFDWLSRSKRLGTKRREQNWEQDEPMQNS